MAIKLKGALAALLQMTAFQVLSVRDESSEDTDLIVVTVKDPITATGSLPLPNGDSLIATESEIYIAADDIEKFQDDCVEENGVTTYKGSLKLDVSKPKFKTVNGVPQVTQRPRIWLRTTLFSRGSQSFQKTNQDKLAQAINEMFGGKKTAVNTGANATGEQKLEPVASVTGGKPNATAVAGAKVGP